MKWNKIKYPNKTFVADFHHTSIFGVSNHVVIITASDKETACEYLKDKLSYEGTPNDLIWLMDTNHKTLYDQTGNKKLKVQAKILFNSHVMTQYN